MFAHSEVFPSFLFHIIIFTQPLSMRHCHSHHHHHNQQMSCHQINQENHDENQGGPTLAPSTSSVCISQSTDHNTKTQSTSSAPSLPSSPSSSLISSMGEHERNEQTQLLSKQKKSPYSNTNLNKNPNDCCAAHSTTTMTATPKPTLKINTATVHFIDSTASSSTKQSPLSSQFEQSAHNHDTQRSNHVIAILNMKLHTIFICLQSFW